MVRQSILAALQPGCPIKLCWLPSRVGINGNEKADPLVASSRYLDSTIIALPYQDFPFKERSLVHTQWQSEQDLEIDNKLHLIKTILGKWQRYPQKTRRIDVPYLFNSKAQFVFLNRGSKVHLRHGYESH